MKSPTTSFSKSQFPRGLKGRRLLMTSTPAAGLGASANETDQSPEISPIRSGRSSRAATVTRTVPAIAAVEQSKPVATVAANKTRHSRHILHDSNDSSRSSSRGGKKPNKKINETVGTIARRTENPALKKSKPTVRLAKQNGRNETMKRTKGHTIESNEKNQRSSNPTEQSALPPEVFCKRYRPPTKALKEIRVLQRSTDELIPKAAFARLVREVTMRITNCDTIRYKSLAIQALQAAAEAYVIGFFEDSYLLTLHSKRKTLLPRDMVLAYRIRGDDTTRH